MTGRQKEFWSLVLVIIFFFALFITIVKVWEASKVEVPETFVVLCGGCNECNN